jgi:hypothetical protein
LNTTPPTSGPQINSPQDDVPRRVPRTHHEEETVQEVLENHGVCHRNQRRAIDHDVVELLPARIEEGRHAL